MTRTVAVISFILLFCSVKFASADFYDECMAGCSKEQTQCIDAITLYDATGVQEAKNACIQQFPVCKKKCHEQDDMGVEEYEAKQKRDAEEAEKKRQEQQDNENGNIKTYNFDNK